MGKSNNREFKIEKGIPVPSLGRGSRYPFNDMAVGDSVFIPDKRPQQLSGSITWAKMQLGGDAVFVCRTVEGGTRVWRVA